MGSYWISPVQFSDSSYRLDCPFCHQWVLINWTCKQNIKHECQPAASPHPSFTTRSWCKGHCSLWYQYLHRICKILVLSSRRASQCLYSVCNFSLQCRGVNLEPHKCKNWNAKILQIFCLKMANLFLLTVTKLSAFLNIHKTHEWHELGNWSSNFSCMRTRWLIKEMFLALLSSLNVVWEQY